MRKRLLVLVFIALSLPAISQSNLLVLKKKNRVVQTWIKGSVINFQFSSMQWIQGYIRGLTRDSISVEMFSVRRYVNQWGVFAIDSGKMGVLKLHVKEVYAVPQRRFARSIFEEGGLYQLGSGAYVLLNIANSLIKNDQVFSARNLTGMGIAAGVFAFGTFLSSMQKEKLVLGKKYTLEILDM